MRVLFWVEAFTPNIGGLEVLSTHLVRALRARRYEICIVTTRNLIAREAVDTFDGIPIYRFPFHSTLHKHDLRQVSEIRAAVRALKQEFKADVLHLNSPVEPSLFFHCLTAGVAPAPSLVSMHGVMPSQMPNSGMVAQALGAANYISVISEAVRADMLRAHPQARERLTLVYNGLPAPSVAPAPLPFDPPRFLCIGRLVPDKGFDVALDAFARVLAARPDAQLVIAGDGAARNALLAQAEQLELSEAVQFVGWVAPEKVHEYINEFTAVVMPSRWQEPFGLVALQAAQMGRPIIASRVGGLPEVVSDEHTGLLVPKEDVAALTGAMLRVARDRALAERLGAGAYERAQTRFSFTRMVDAYDALYQRTAAEPVRAALAVSA